MKAELVIIGILIGSLTFSACGSDGSVAKSESSSQAQEAAPIEEETVENESASQLLENPGWQIAAIWEGKQDVELAMKLPDGILIEEGSEGSGCIYFDAHPYIKDKQSRLIQCQTLAGGSYEVKITNHSNTEVSVTIERNVGRDENNNRYGGAAFGSNVIPGYSTKVFEVNQYAFRTIE